MTFKEKYLKIKKDASEHQNMGGIPLYLVKELEKIDKELNLMGKFLNENDIKSITPIEAMDSEEFIDEFLIWKNKKFGELIDYENSDEAEAENHLKEFIE